MYVMLKVKPSRFNLVVETQANGAILLFNTFSTALCWITRESQRFLNETQYETNELSVDDKKTIEQFLAMGFIVNRDVDELKHLELRQNLTRYGNRNLLLTIGPTMNCNMRCPYCFESEQHQTMTSETAEKLIGFIKDYIEAKKIESANIVWYGGEPLLALEQINQISKEVISFCEKRNTSYSARIVTNGYCLDRNNAELLKSLKVEYAQITIDGLEKTHNARRKLKNGGESFWPIVRNIEDIKDILRIVIRVNVDKNNMHEIDALTDFFIDDMKWGKNPSFYLAPVDKCTETCKAEPEKCLSPNDFSSLYQRIMTKLFENGITEIIHQNYPSYIDVGCAGICINSFVIDANGCFYTCWNRFGDTSKSIGNLDEPNKIGLQGDYLHWLTVPIPERCRNCVYLPICQAGCPEQRIKNQNQPTCVFSPLMYVENLKLAFREYTAKK